MTLEYSAPLAVLVSDVRGSRGWDRQAFGTAAARIAPLSERIWRFFNR